MSRPGFGAIGHWRRIGMKHPANSRDIYRGMRPRRGGKGCRT